MKLKQRAKQLKTDIPTVFLAMKQVDTPKLAKVLAALTLAYGLSPIDLIPDFIPVLGYLDDIILLPALITLTVRLIPPDIIRRCREQVQNSGDVPLRRKWYYAMPILLIWAIVVFLIIWTVIF